MMWLVLVAAGLLEIGWALGLKYSEGFTRSWPTVLTAAAMIASLALLGVAMRSLPLGTAYAVWTGIGAVGAFIVGVVAFGESASALRIASMVLIVAGLVGLRLATPAQ